MPVDSSEMKPINLFDRDFKPEKGMGGMPRLQARPSLTTTTSMARLARRAIDLSTATTFDKANIAFEVRFVLG